MPLPLTRLLLAAAALAALVSPTPAAAYRVAFSVGEKEHLQALEDTDAWSETAEKMDLEMFFGYWPSGDVGKDLRRNIMEASKTSTTVVEVGYQTRGQDQGWVTQRSLDAIPKATILAGGRFQWVVLYNSKTGGVEGDSNLTAEQLGNAKDIFDEQWRPSKKIQWATIIRRWNDGQPAALSPFDGFLYEIRINDYLENENRRRQVNEAVAWGLDHEKTVFVQLIAPRGEDPMYVTDYYKSMLLLRAAVGLERLKSDRLVIVASSYDASAEAVSSVPELDANGNPNERSISGAALLLLRYREELEDGRTPF